MFTIQLVPFNQIEFPKILIKVSQLHQFLFIIGFYKTHISYDNSNNKTMVYNYYVISISIMVVNHTTNVTNKRQEKIIKINKNRKTK